MNSWPLVTVAFLLVALVGALASSLLAIVGDVAAMLAGPSLLQAITPPSVAAQKPRLFLVFAPAALAASAVASLVLFGFDRPRLLIAAVEIVYLASASIGLWQAVRRRTFDEIGLRIRSLLLVAVAAWLLVEGRLMWLGVIFASAGLVVLLAPALLTRATAKYSKSGANAGDLAKIRDAMLAAARDRQLYRNPDLTLSDLAAAAGVSSGQASQALSQSGNTSFAELIAALRVAEAARLLSLPENAAVAIEPIGMEAGFRSRSNFYAAFKRVHGTSPAEYRSSVLK